MEKGRSTPVTWPELRSELASTPSSQLTHLSRREKREAFALGSRVDIGPSALAVTISVLGILYVLQAISPMRLDNDSVVYLHMATSIADGIRLEPTGLPPGYPTLIAALDGLGLGRSFVFVLMNCVFIAIGLACVQFVFQQSRSGRISWVVPLSMLSVMFIRYLPMPLPEPMFVGVSMAAVAAMTAAVSGVGRRRLCLLGAAIVLTIMAITVRLAGFALIPALLWSCFHRTTAASEKSLTWARTGKWLAAATLVGVTVVAVIILRESFRKYFFEAALGYQDQDVWTQTRVRVQGMLWTIGALAINVPLTRFSAYRPAFLIAGFTIVAWISSTVRIRLPRTPAGIYLLSFLFVLLIWPYNAQRLWLPIVPLLIGNLEGASLRFEPGRKWKMFMRAYIAWFTFAAACALGYTTSITFSGKNFPNVYGRAGGMSAPDPTTGKINTLHNQRARELMKRYGNPF